jgi:phosphonate transport system permease protein
MIRGIWYNWQEAATVLLAILVLVIIGEFAAAWLRKRII